MLVGGERIPFLCHHSKVSHIVTDILAAAELAAKDRETANPISGKPEDHEYADLLHGTGVKVAAMDNDDIVGLRVSTRHEFFSVDTAMTPSEAEMLANEILSVVAEIRQRGGPQKRH